MLHKGHSRDTPPCVPSLGSVHQTRGLLYPLKQRVPTSPPSTVGEAEPYLGHSNKAASQGVTRV